jgi:hypothetical protein
MPLINAFLAIQIIWVEYCRFRNEGQVWNPNEPNAPMNRETGEPSNEANDAN